MSTMSSKEGQMWQLILALYAQKDIINQRLSTLEKERTAILEIWHTIREESAALLDTVSIIGGEIEIIKDKLKKAKL